MSLMFNTDDESIIDGFSVDFSVVHNNRSFYFFKGIRVLRQLIRVTMAIGFTQKCVDLTLTILVSSHLFQCVCGCGQDLANTGLRPYLVFDSIDEYEPSL